MVVQLPAAIFATTLISSSSHALARGAPAVVAALRGGGVVEGFVRVGNSCDVVDSVLAGGDASKHGLCGAEATSGGSAAMLAQRSPVRGLAGLAGLEAGEGGLLRHIHAYFSQAHSRWGADDDDTESSMPSPGARPARSYGRPASGPLGSRMAAGFDGQREWDRSSSVSREESETRGEEERRERALRAIRAEVHANGGAATDDHLVRLKAHMRRRDAPASPARKLKLCSFVGGA
eukprot:CAMPEP_0180250562 /NCGR_PEP_ID=MMETSP0987-20121128/37952_1 /TAXON_ID=697907 /ORGANISM="non described non described, Strain CCMP2293" /LENGTH=233 /DNA_ID=CAMNT_0022219009 /DNA_START=28 /DNA_END=730 /DNA_ORIENTATION=+